MIFRCISNWSNLLLRRNQSNVEIQKVISRGNYLSHYFSFKVFKMTLKLSFWDIFLAFAFANRISYADDQTFKQLNLRVSRGLGWSGLQGPSPLSPGFLHWGWYLPGKGVFQKSSMIIQCTLMLYVINT